MSLPSSISWTPSSTAGREIAAPRWTTELFPHGRDRMIRLPGGVSMKVREAESFTLVSVSISDARGLSADQFEKSTAEVYRAIQQELQAGPSPHPVRVWNYLPDIHAQGADGIERYMAFNAGRFRAYTDWFGGTGRFDRFVPSASAVGHEGNELVVHALGSQSPGVAVANPRQVAPHLYSRRFGPLPPCFARATVLVSAPAAKRRILVGGTASIRGEESVHWGALAEQIAETFDNLGHLIRAASSPSAPHRSEVMSTAEKRQWLSRFLELRVYYLRESDRAFIESRVAEEFAPHCRVEYMRADLCRAELLVEIEGLAEVQP